MAAGGTPYSVPLSRHGQPQIIGPTGFVSLPYYYFARSSAIIFKAHVASCEPRARVGMSPALELSCDKLRGLHSRGFFKLEYLQSWLDWVAPLLNLCRCRLRFSYLYLLSFDVCEFLAFGVYHLCRAQTRCEYCDDFIALKRCSHNSVIPPT